MKEGWEYKKLGEVCETASGGTPSKSHAEYYEGGSIPWLRSGELKRNIVNTEYCITEEGLKHSSAKMMPQNTVVIAMYGATVGSVGMLKINATTNQAVCGLLPTTSYVPDFLYYFLLSQKDKFIKAAVGGAQPNISQQKIKNTLAPVPPLPEQQAIVEELDLLNAIVDKKKAELEELNKLAQSIFYDMFGDPVENEKGWEVKCMIDVCTKITDGTHQPPKFLESGIPFIFVSNVRNHRIDYNTEKFISDEEYARLTKTTPIEIGDILYTSVGSYGNPAMVRSDKKFCFQRHIAILKLKHEVLDGVFVENFLSNKSVRQYVDTIAIGIAQKTVNLKAIKSIPIILPPLPLQQEFATRISAIEAMKEKVEASLSEVQMLLAATMDKYFG